jgi:hypothetical protein
MRPSQPQIVVDSDGDLPLGAEVALSGLDIGMSKKKLDLFEVAAILTTECRSGAVQIVSPKRSMPISFADCSTALHTAQSPS